MAAVRQPSPKCRLALTALHAAVLEIVRDPGLPNLSMRQTAVLVLLDREPLERRHLRTLAATVEVAKPSVTRALDRLEELGYATRRRGDVDRRDVQATITDHGRAWLDRFGRAGAAALPASSAA